MGCQKLTPHFAEIQGYRIAVDIDLAKFFDTVNHDLLMHFVSRKVYDKRVLALIGKYLRAGAKVNGRLEKTRLGVPQGGPLSPLLANILTRHTGNSDAASSSTPEEAGGSR